MALLVVGLLSSVYLSYHAAFPTTQLVCPAEGPLSCDQVTSSQYGELFGVSVAYLGLAWFVVVLALVLLGDYKILLPLWAAGVAFVIYLVTAETLLIHAFCVYCAIAHLMALLVGYPIMKLRIANR